MKEANTIVVTAIVVKNNYTDLNKIAKVEIKSNGSVKRSISALKRLYSIKYFACDDSAINKAIHAGQFLAAFSTLTTMATTEKDNDSFHEFSKAIG